MTVLILALLSILLWFGCFGARRATINSRELDADIKRIFEGTKR